MEELVKQLVEAGIPATENMVFWYLLFDGNIAEGLAVSSVFFTVGFIIRSIIKLVHKHDLENPNKSRGL